MVVVLFLCIARTWKDRRELSTLVGLVSGLVSAYLMNRERMRAEDTSGLIAVGLTGWFWLGLSSTIGLPIVSSLRFLKRPHERAADGCAAHRAKLWNQGGDRVQDY
jgi:hypothetical protein